MHRQAVKDEWAGFAENDGSGFPCAERGAALGHQQRSTPTNLRGAGAPCFPPSISRPLSQPRAASGLGGAACLTPMPSPPPALPLAGAGTGGCAGGSPQLSGSSTPQRHLSNRLRAPAPLRGETSSNVDRAASLLYRGLPHPDRDGVHPRSLPVLSPLKSNSMPCLLRLEAGERDRLVGISSSGLDGCAETPHRGHRRGLPVTSSCADLRAPSVPSVSIAQDANPSALPAVPSTPARSIASKNDGYSVHVDKNSPDSPFLFLPMMTPSRQSTDAIRAKLSTPSGGTRNSTSSIAIACSNPGGHGFRLEAKDLPVVSPSSKHTLLSLGDGTCGAECNTSTTTSGQGGDTTEEFSNDSWVDDGPTDEHVITKSDVDWVLSTLSEEERDNLQQPWFYDNCRRLFQALDSDGSGFVEVQELRSANLVDVFPTLQLDLVEGTRHIPPLTSASKSLLVAFDTNKDGRISEEEFPEFVRFCQAWRIRQYLKTQSLCPNRRSTPSAAAALPPKLMSKSASTSKILRKHPPVQTAAATAPASSSRPPSSGPPTSRSMRNSAPRVSTCTRPSLQRTASNNDWAVELRGASISAPRRPANLPLPARKVPRSRSGSLQRSEASTTSQPPISRSSSRQSQDSQRQRRENANTVSEPLETRQIDALEVLIDHISHSALERKPLVACIGQLLAGVVTRDGVPVFTEDAVREALEAVAAHESDCGDGGNQSSIILSVLRFLAKQVGLEFSDLAGQVLSRNRFSAPLQRSRHKSTAESMEWLCHNTVNSEAVFDAFTRNNGGRMVRKEWQKVVELVRRNPLLHARIRHTDADRLFVSFTARREGLDRTISLNDFIVLLLQLAETADCHPSMIFVAVGVHGERLQEETKQRPASTSTSAVSSRPSSAATAVKAAV